MPLLIWLPNSGWVLVVMPLLTWLPNSGWVLVTLTFRLAWLPNRGCVLVCVTIGWLPKRASAEDARPRTTATTAVRIARRDIVVAMRFVRSRRSPRRRVCPRSGAGAVCKIAQAGRRRARRAIAPPDRLTSAIGMVRIRRSHHL